MGKRRFGRVRRLRSGRWQARYPGPDGTDRPAPETFSTKGDAERWLSVKEAEIIKGEWINPDDGKISLADYAETWIEERPGLRPKTIDSLPLSPAQAPDPSSRQHAYRRYQARSRPALAQGAA